MAWPESSDKNSLLRKVEYKKNGVDCQEKDPQDMYEKRFWTSVADNDYQIMHHGPNLSANDYRRNQ
jgi:hypothetical protein